MSSCRLSLRMRNTCSSSLRRATSQVLQRKCQRRNYGERLYTMHGRVLSQACYSGIRLSARAFLTVMPTSVSRPFQPTRVVRFRSVLTTVADFFRWISIPMLSTHSLTMHVLIWIFSNVMHNLHSVWWTISSTSRWRKSTSSCRRLRPTLRMMRLSLQSIISGRR